MKLTDSELKRITSIYLSDKLLTEIDARRDILSRNAFIESCIRATLDSDAYTIQLEIENEKLKRELEHLKREFEYLRKENEKLKSRLARLQEKLKQKKEDKGESKLLSKLRSNDEELRALAAEIEQHMQHGKRWKEVCESAGITELNAQLTVLHKLFSEIQQQSFVYLVGRYIQNFVLRKKLTDAYADAQVVEFDRLGSRMKNIIEEFLK